MNVCQEDEARSVLVETLNVLGAFREQLVVVGGWVPDLLYPGKQHIGSIDVDLAVAPEALADNAYSTIRARMSDAGFRHHSPPTRFTRAAGQHEIKVDLITGQYQAGQKVPAILLNELQINTLRGLDLAFEYSAFMEITGRMPSGAINTVNARVVLPEAFVLIKAFAMNDRLKAKDAYDVYFVASQYPGGPQRLGIRIAAMRPNGLVEEAIQILQAKFAQLRSIGPVHVAEVLSERGADAAQSQQAAYQYLTAMLQAISDEQ
ncbi:MAG: nucleotidyl transferase AbiEii/AbiGii toxin family protein [Planctomycetaceae bacterium]|nr:nucleotidyl transferase AbiEii/AbiGii toxin family protein [Planctomycetaceae bacterium]